MIGPALDTYRKKNMIGAALRTCGHSSQWELKRINLLAKALPVLDGTIHPQRNAEVRFFGRFLGPRQLRHGGGVERRPDSSHSIPINPNQSQSIPINPNQSQSIPINPNQSQSIP
eukprot:SAG31_NODE_13406_length_871_cov_1.544041_1_plen_114_part_10